MADRNASDSRNIHSPAAYTPPIYMDNQGSDSSIPLSPQWLLPKMGEIKHESGNEDERSGSVLKNDKHLDILNSSKSGEVLDPPKRKDVFRPSLLDQETVRHDRWRDEERDTNPAVRRDRWREGDREPADNRKIDRWSDKLASKHYGENQRASSDRWGDSGNKDAGHERRESKWTNRWGPTDKDKEVLHEKPRESGRVGDTTNDKGVPTQSTIRKDDKEGDVYRPWKLNSSSQSRGRGDTPHSQTLTPSKNFAFSYGRGRSENQSQPLGHTLGRPSISISQSSEFVSDKEEIIHLESSFLRYSRAKLLDVYRTMDKHSSWKLLDDFVGVPSLTQDELSDPLGLSAPSPEETDILIGIDKGEVLSSGVPVNSKEKPSERHPSDFSQSRRPVFGSREDLPHIIDGSRNDNADEGDLRGKQARHHSENNTPLHKSGDLSGSRDVGAKRDTYVPPGSSLRSPSVLEHAHLSHWERNVSDNTQSSGHEYVRSPHMKNLSDDRENGSTYKLYQKNEPKWQVGGHRVTDTQSFGSVHQGKESRKLPPPSPEDLILFYKDPQGNIQGPFSGSDIIGWYDAGYFGIDLQVRLASASEDHPFSVLGDVMPHLRSKAQPPPGFNAPKQSDPLDVNSKLSHSNSGKLLGNSSESDSLKNDLRPMHGFSTDADNRFLESLMAGPQGFFGNNSSSVSPIGVDNANLYLLAQKMALEHQQRSWPGRDPSQVISKPEIGPEGVAVHPKLQPPLVDNTCLTPPSQNSELLNMLQGVSERSTSGLHSSPNRWSNFPVPGGPIRDNMDLYRGQNVHQSSLVGIQHQILQAQNSPLLVNLLSQSSQSAAMKPETIPSFPQDPQTLSMLQQQYLINLHSQTPPLQQLSVLDKLLLLQQQQKKLSEQQQLLRQQNMHSQAFSEILPQHPGGLPYGQMQVNASQGGGVDQLQPHMAQLQFNASMYGPSTVHDDNISELHKVHPQDVSVLKSQTPQVISKLGTQIPQEVIQSGSNVSQDALKFDPSSPVEVYENFAAQFADQPSKNTTSAEIDFSQHLTETHKRIAPIDEEVGDGYKSLGNSDSLSLKPSNVSADATLTLQSVSRNHSSAPPKSVELHDSSKVNSYSTENHNEKSKERVIESHQIIMEPALEKDTKITETYEGKKGSEKKSRKQKASKASEQARGVSKTAVKLNKLGETDGTNVNISKGEPSVDNQSDDRVQQIFSGYENILKDGEGSIRVNAEPKSDEGFPSQNSQLPLAWKPAPGFKPKSLLEIQQEELRRSQAEAQTAPIASSANSSSLSTPWAGVVANADTKTSKGSYMDMGSIESVSNRALKSQSSKSEFQDLLADKVNTKLNDVELPRDNQMFMSPDPLEHTNSEPTNDLDFIQAKDTKKSRKKSGKTKSGSSKVISVTPDASLGSSPIEKIKNSRQVHQETEVLPPVPSGPSFGDFVVWKGDGSTASSVSSSYAPAWSTDSGKVQPVLLRDILKEQEKKTQSHPSHQKPQSTQPAPGSIPSRAPVASSLSKAQVPTQVNSISTQSKHSGDDDLFWGPIDSSKKDAKQSDFPQLTSHSVSVSKSSTPLKGNIGNSTKQKSVASKTADYSQSYSPQTTLKGRKDSKSKQSEAMDFRDWCQAESVRLIGTKDTSFLEFCLKQTRSEAEILLVENIGSYDPKHEFIDKFLNYKELLPADVLEIAFQSQNDQKSISGQASLNTAVVVVESTTQEPSTVTSGGKKKSKKGKKVSPSVLGFNVVSNRIMMGEIQTVED